MAIVRPVAAGDLRAVADLRWRWRTEEGGERNPDRERWTAAFVEWLRLRSDSHRGQLAEAGGDVVGEGWLAIVDRVPTVAPGPDGMLGTRRSGYVQALYVVPEHRNAGIGEQITQALIADARGLSLHYLAVHPSEPSFPLYRRVGFADTDRVLQLEL